MRSKPRLAIIDAVEEPPSVMTARRSASRYLSPIANEPLISHVASEVARSGVDEIRILASERDRSAVEAVLGSGDEWGIPLSYSSFAPEESKTALVGQITGSLDDGPVLVTPGDCLFPNQLSRLRDRFSEAECDLVLLAHVEPRVKRSQALITRPTFSEEAQVPGGRGRVDETAEDRVIDTAAVLDRSTKPLLQQLLADSAADQKPIDFLLAADCRYDVLEAGPHWCYSSTTAELLLGNQVLLDALPIETIQVELPDRSRISGRVAIQSSARISSSTIRGPTVIGEHALVEDSFIGPYTAIGAGTVIRGAEIENAIVLAGAEIQHPGVRIEASVIGEGATISRSFELPQGLHLRLGPGARVILS